MNRFGVLDADEVDADRNRRKYKAAYFDNHSGGFYVTQKGHIYHREELEAAKVLALHGLQIVMQPEGDGSGGVTLRVSSKTNANLYPEGRIGSVWYEQFTTNKLSQNPINAAKNALSHAHKKGAEIAVIYDKQRVLHGVHIQQAVSHYKAQRSNHAKSVNQVLIITKPSSLRGWRVWSWQL